MANGGLTRRRFFGIAGAGVAAAGLAGAGNAFAEPQSDNAQWLTNPQATKLIGPDDMPIVSMPAETPMRAGRLLPTGQIEVWVPRYGLYGWVPPSVVTSMSAPAPQDLAGEMPAGPPLIGADRTGVRDLHARALSGGSPREGG